ncbi:gamma-glutamyl-gamma-aminobutyrate hydrolase family protein [Salinithrix halophila]|uniref:Gamma-glutamyl-gamma-aminobutyrate hydrolase family protein n=1 Tax=Salinithrix halophila TaxID=1485204 RepID=A0ABV8JFD2_9BACL
MKRKPLIGLTGYHVRGEEGHGGTFRGLPGQGFHVVGHDYIQAVGKAGGLPIGLPVLDPREAKGIIAQLDGLLLSGGEDIDPSLYGERPDMRCWTLVPERDQFELALLREAMDQGLPVLAVCRGMQLLNIAFGGTLYKDVSDIPGGSLCHQFHRAPRWYPAHRVTLKGKELKQWFQTDEIETNSYHHQVVKEVGMGLEVAAVAEDGVVESLRHPDHPQVLAIQWHPETMAVQNERGMIPFHWLIARILERGG